MKSHELAKQLLKYPDLELFASVDISTCDEDAEARVFGNTLHGIQHNENMDNISLLFIDGIIDK